MAKADVPELVAAAQTIETDQLRLEELARALQKTKLQTEKSIGRAARELQEALGQQEALALSLRALGQAMLHMQERQQAAVGALSERAVEIQTRRSRLSEHMLRYASLGTKAAELLETMSTALGQPAQSDAVQAATKQLDAIVEEAATLSREARDEDFTEVAHEADVLKQKFAQIRTQLGSRKEAPN
jgi:chromosome segregation ATPase